MSFQTYSNWNGANQYETFLEAYNAWKLDSTIWKISFEFNGVDMIWCPKMKSDRWHRLSEERIGKMLQQYADEHDLSKVYWILQTSANKLDLVLRWKALVASGEFSEERCSKVMITFDVSEVILQIYSRIMNGEITQDEGFAIEYTTCIHEVMSNEDFLERFSK